MSEEQKYRLYLYDLGLLIKENALKVKDQTKASEDSERKFLRGILFGYAEVIGLMQQEAQAFGIGLDELRLDDIRPEGDLI